MILNQDETERFFSKIKKTDYCWEWIGGKYSTGYGMLCIKRGNRKTFGAHRISWAIHNKSHIPPKMMVCHKCDNRGCVNPEHLYVGTGYDNNNDTVKRGRGNRKFGESCSWARLREEDVKNIRELRKSGFKFKEIAEMYDTDYRNVWDIVNFKNWKHVS